MEQSPWALGATRAARYGRGPGAPDASPSTLDPVPLTVQDGASVRRCALTLRARARHLRTADHAAGELRVQGRVGRPSCATIQAMGDRHPAPRLRLQPGPL